MRPDSASGDELLAAYCDGVTELTADERKRVEALLAGDASARADESETRALLGTLRELPGEGGEPNWTAMERAISSKVGPTVPRPWWRPAWRLLVPITALAIAATAAVFYLRTTDVTPNVPDEPTAAAIDAGVADPGTDEAPEIALWLDGEDILVDESAEDLLDVDGMLLGQDDRMIEGLLPMVDLAWVDELDDEDIAAAEDLLADDSLTNKRKRS